MKEITVGFGRESQLGRNKEHDREIYIKLSTAFSNEQLKELKGAPLSVFICLALHMDDNGECWVSNELIMQETGYGKDSITKAKSFLVEEGYIYCRKRVQWTKELIKKRFPDQKLQNKMMSKLGTWAPLTYSIFPEMDEAQEVREILKVVEEDDNKSEDLEENTVSEKTIHGKYGEEPPCMVLPDTVPPASVPPCPVGPFPINPDINKSIPYTTTNTNIGVAPKTGNNKTSEIYSMYHSVFGKMPNYYQIQKIFAYLEYGIEGEAILYAMELTGGQGAELSYLTKILNNWLKEGVRTLEQAKEYSVKRKIPLPSTESKSRSSPCKKAGKSKWQMGLDFTKFREN